MQKIIIHTDQAPAPIGCYNQAIKIGNTVYISGQISLEPHTGEIAMGGPSAQIRQAFANLQAVAEAAGGSLADIVKLNVFLHDLINFEMFNQFMGDYFTPPYPARAVLGVRQLPKDAAIELDAIMVLPDETYSF